MPLGKGASPILVKIMGIQKEIALINLHSNEHVTNDGAVKLLEQSCQYCQAHTGKLQQVEPEQLPEKKEPTLNELERIVDCAGKKGQVIVPRTWAGKRVRIVLLD